MQAPCPIDTLSIWTYTQIERMRLFYGKTTKKHLSHGGEF